MSSKKVVWQQPKITSARKPGTYGSFREFMEKANKFRAEQEEAQNYLVKAMPAMVKLLEIKMTNKEPLTVMRPLTYQTSGLEKSQMDEIDRAYYRGSQTQQNKPDKFVDYNVTINPGTQLVLKGLDVPLREFLFEDAQGNEHSISFDDRNKLLTQTDIFETVRNLLEGNKGE